MMYPSSAALYILTFTMVFAAIAEAGLEKDSPIKTAAH